MPGRPRIDLDGLTLLDASKPLSQVIAILRYRTTQGLVMLVPESADVLVPWEHIEQAKVDLELGTVEIRLNADFVAKENWLRGANDLKGEWMDRVQLDAERLGVRWQS